VPGLLSVLATCHTHTHGFVLCSHMHTHRLLNVQHSPHHSLHTYMHGSVLAYYAHICTRTQVFQCAAQSSQPVTHIRMVAYYAHKCTRTQASLCAAQTYNLGCTYIHTHTGSSVCSKTTRCCGTSSRTTISTPPKPSPGVVSVPRPSPPTSRRKPQAQTVPSY